MFVEQKKQRRNQVTAQLSFTLTQEEMLQLLSSNNSECDNSEAFRELLQKTLNQFIQWESTEKLVAEQYESGEERTDHRNGTRERQLTTRIGTITLTVPRHRNVPFHTITLGLDQIL